MYNFILGVCILGLLLTIPASRHGLLVMYLVGVGYMGHFFGFVFKSLWPVFFLITYHPNNEKLTKICSGSKKQKCSVHFCVFLYFRVFEVEMTPHPKAMLVYEATNKRRQS